VPDATAEPAPEAFVARYSVARLLVWVALSGGMGAAGLFVAVRGASAVTLLAGGAGALFFGGIAVLLAARLLDRRPQVIVDSNGLYVRSHGETRIALHAIETMRTDAHSQDMVKLAIFLFEPASHPIETWHRQFIWRINGSGAREFFGDVWIWATHLDQPVEAVIRAIWAHFPATELEQRAWALEDAAPGIGPRAI
jgi:hypothetical protein